MPDQTITKEHPEKELQGADAIARLIGDLPQTPGVYRMIGKDDAVLYVGKAKSLKKRVSSYLRSSGQPIRIQRMIAATRSMEFVSTHTETEALLLEANLIKRMRPPYNVLLRDDKSFAYILLTKDHEAPAIIKHRGAKRRDGDYFGPFASAGAVNMTINALQKAFLLRNCSDAFYQNRTRPCLQHQIRRCAAPCTGEISQEDYAGLAAGARAFLSGKNQEVKTRLAADMEAAAAQLNYEKAALYRDRIAALSQITARQDINPLGLDQADMFTLHREANHFCVQVFFFRAGQNWGNQAYFSKAEADVTDGEILESLIAQFYDKRPCPQLLLVSHSLPEPALLSKALSVRSARKVTIHHPQRGGKRQLIMHGLNNAKEALARRMADRSVNRELLEKLAALLSLPQVPQRIEVYDNSHLSGQNPVGAMIVAGLGGFAKRHYRKFNIRSEALTPGDDYAMLREVLERRFSRLISRQESAPEKTGSIADDDSQNKDEMPDWPDLILIDGGRGQLNTAIEVAKKKGLEKLVLASIAKGPDRDAGREKIYCAGKSPFRLPLRDPVLFFLQRLRDEAHRFAIGAQRSRRKKSLTENPLDEIGGIGPARKKILLHHFGTVREIARAGTDDLARIPSISHQVARRIYDHFHE